MESEENFKKSLQDKIESKEFAFDEKEWDKAAAIIDSHKKGGRRGVFYFLSGAFLFILSFVTFTVFINAKNTNTSHAYKNFNYKTSENNLFVEKTIRANSSQVQEKSQASNNKLISQTKKIAAPSLDTQLSANSQSIPTRSEVLSSNESNPIELFTSNTQNHTSSTIEKLNNNSMHSNSTPTKPGENVNEEVFELEALPLVSAPIKKTDDLAIAGAPPVETASVLTNESNTKTLLDSSEKKKAPIENVKALAAVKNDSSQKTPPLAIPEIHNILNFEFGGAFLFGWNNSDGKDANGLNVVAGLNYLSHIYQNYWFSLGIQYNSVRNLSYSSKTSKVTRYKLGEESDVTTITPSTLHYLSFPFKLHYQLNEKNSFGLGYTANYLVNVESKVDTYTEKVYGSENHETYTTGGYTEGFKLFTSQIGLYYRRHLIKDLSLNAEFVFGLNDIKDNSFFNANTIERNTGIKVTLSYNLFKH